MRDGGRRAQRWAALAAALLAVAAAAAEQRFPQPDFKSGYAQPFYAPPAVDRSAWREWVDVAALAGGLALAAWLAVKRRSRAGLWALSVVCLAGFGFVRKGCVCPVGSVQNVAVALADRSQAVPWTVALLFVLPLVFALLYGRVFCAAVCPLGAVQDLVIARPLRLPRWLSRPLSLLAPTYLALALGLAVSGAGFWICRYDPFVGLFRRGGPAGMIATGIGLLAIGMVVARPYCRFLCPYGVLLGWCSRLARRHLAITPDECIQCRLCEESCPFDAIREPEPPHVDRAAARRALVLALVAAPLLVAGSAAAARAAALALAERLHPDVALAVALRAEEAAGKVDETWETRAFRVSGAPRRSADEQAVSARRRLATAWTWAGGFIGWIVAVRWIATTRRESHADYVPDRGDCLSCGRCFAHCPREYVRLGRLESPFGQP